MAASPTIRHIPESNDPESLAVAFNRVWDELERGSAGSGSQVSLHGALGTSGLVGTTVPPPAPPAFHVPVLVVEGGTSLLTLTNHAVMLGQDTSPVGFTNLGVNGSVLAGQTGADPAFVTLSGDLTMSAAGLVTLATVNANVGTFTALTVNAKGLTTAATNLAITGDATGTASGSGLTLVNVNLPTGVTQAGYLLLTNIAAPGAPAAGKVRTYADSTNKIFSAVNESGTVSNTAVPKTATSHQWLTSMSATGVFASSQPAFTDISGTATASQGGTGNSLVPDVGDILACLAGGSFDIVAGSTAASTLKVLTSTATFMGVATAPAWAQLAASDLSNGTTGSGAVVLASNPTMTNPVVGTQAPGNNTTLAASTAFVTAAITASGGTNPMTTLGDTIYGAAAGAETRLAGNITSTLKVLSQTGTGAVSAAPVWTSAVSTNTASTLVLRDGSGNFSAGTITAALSGNATTATAWATGRTITLTSDVTGVSGSFDGSGNLSFATTLANIPTAVTMAGYLTATAIAAPGAGAAGKVRVYTDSTNLVLSSVNSSGTVSNTAVPISASATKFITAMSAAGVFTQTQPAASDLSVAALANGITATTQAAGDNSTKLATTAFVQTAITSIDSKDQVAYCSTAALPSCTYANGASGVGATLTATANGPLIIDGVTSLLAAVGSRMLIAGQASGFQNGWYTLTQLGVVAVSPWILTRAVDSDQAAEIGPGYLTAVEAPTGLTPGTSNNQKVFLSAAPSPFVVGTDTVTFALVGGTYTAGTGLTLTGTQFSIDVAYVGQTSITTLGTIGTGAWQGTKVGLAYGGTNADLSGTGGTSQVLKQTGVGSAVTVGQLAFTDISGVATAAQTPALTGDVTKPSGSATTTVVNLPTGVTQAGYLAVTAIVAPSTPAAGLGRTYVDSTSKNLCVKDDAGVVKHGAQTIAAVASNWLTACNDAGLFSAAQPAFSDISGTAATGQIPNLGANPSAKVGPTATNGTATTYIRSDGASAIDLTGVYPWTASHTWANTDTAATSGTVNPYTISATGTPAADSTADYRGFTITSQSSGTNKASTVTGLQVNATGGATGAAATTIKALRLIATNSSTSAVGNLYGLQGTASVSGTGNVTTSAEGGRFNVSVTAASTVTQGVGLNVLAPTISGGGAITTLIGLLVGNQTGGGTSYSFQFGTGLGLLNDTTNSTSKTSDASIHTLGGISCEQSIFANSYSGALASACTGVTQALGDNSTAVATDAFAMNVAYAMAVCFG